MSKLLVTVRDTKSGTDREETWFGIDGLSVDDLMDLGSTPEQIANIIVGKFNSHLSSGEAPIELISVEFEESDEDTCPYCDDPYCEGDCDDEASCPDCGEPDCKGNCERNPCPDCEDPNCSGDCEV